MHACVVGDNVHVSAILFLGQLFYSSHNCSKLVVQTFCKIIYFIDIITGHFCLSRPSVIVHNACSTHLYRYIHVTVIDSDIVHGSHVGYAGGKQHPFV